MQQQAGVRFRWTGTAGIELAYQNCLLLIDPYVTRISFWRQWVGAVTPDRELVQETFPRADFILVTHAHFDHLLDVPAVMEATGAVAVGSDNTCALLGCLGMPASHIQQVTTGAQIEIGEFTVDVLPARHGWTPGFNPGTLKHDLKPPLTARDYRMDECYSYLIAAGGLRLIVAAGEPQGGCPRAEVLFANPAYVHARDQEWLSQVQPQVVIPIHWDVFWHPLNRPLRPMLQPPRWTWPPIQRTNLEQFRQVIEAAVPGARVMIPEILRIYDLQDAVKPAQTTFTRV